MTKHSIEVTTDELTLLVRAMGREVEATTKEIVGRDERADDPDFMQAFYNVRQQQIEFRRRLMESIPQAKRRR